MSENQIALKALYDQLLEHDAPHFERQRADAQRAGQGINTGYKLHSRLASGEFKDFNLWIPKYAITMVCARTGGAKTTWMVNLANRMAQNGANGMFITLEEPGFAIRAKMLASYTREKNINFSMEATTTRQAVRAISGKYECEEMTEFDAEIMRRVRIVDANSSVDLKKIETPTLMYQPQFIAGLIEYRNQKADKPLDFVIIDFGQLMESMDSDNHNSYQRMKGVMQALKNLAGGLGIAVVVGAQMKRECWNIPIWDWEPEMIRDGSDMEQAASLVIASGHDKDYPDPLHNMVFRFLKNRHGPKRVSGMFSIDFEYSYIPLQGKAPADD